MNNFYLSIMRSIIRRRSSDKITNHHRCHLFLQPDFYTFHSAEYGRRQLCVHDDKINKIYMSNDSIVELGAFQHNVILFELKTKKLKCLDIRRVVHPLLSDWYYYKIMIHLLTWFFFLRWSFLKIFYIKIWNVVYFIY